MKLLKLEVEIRTEDVDGNKVNVQKEIDNVIQAVGSIWNVRGVGISDNRLERDVEALLEAILLNNDNGLIKDKFIWGEMEYITHSLDENARKRLKTIGSVCFRKII